MVDLFWALLGLVIFTVVMLTFITGGTSSNSDRTTTPLPDLKDD